MSMVMNLQNDEHNKIGFYVENERQIFIYENRIIYQQLIDVVVF